MPPRALLLVLAATAGGCTEVGDAPADIVVVRDTPHASTSARMARVPVADVCDVLPQEGPCACACDHDALVEGFVPPGTCAAFHCELLDGRAIAIHACHPDD